MRYFIMSDVHGYYDILKSTLKENNFDVNNPDHILIIAGDIFDRGRQPKQLMEFLQSIPKNRFIYIRGNHEDLIIDAVLELREHGFIFSGHHHSNGTVQTIMDFTGFLSMREMYLNINSVLKKLKPLLAFINTSIDYYEFDKYIVVHGWIPCDFKKYIENWRDAGKLEWRDARWSNGIELAKNNILEPSKTIICGHYHTGYGHYNYHKEGSNEYDKLDIYYDNGIIALDAMTGYSKTINCLIIDII